MPVITINFHLIWNDYPSMILTESSGQASKMAFKMQGEKL